MKRFKDYITEDISTKTRKETKLLVDVVYSKYIKKYSKNQQECVGWLDGSKNALIRNQKIYEVGIEDNDSVLDIGCGVAHLYEFLKMGGWNGKYLGIDPNKKAIDMIDENINTMHGTIEDLPDFMKYDWVIASGVFNLGLTENLTFSIIHNMISHANKGIIFNMLQAPYEDPKYEAYYPEWIKRKLSKFDHRKIEIIEGYMGDDAEFTVYFYV